MFIDSDIASITRNDLCEWMDVESNINGKKGMVEYAMSEEDDSKVLKVVPRKIRTMMDKTVSLPTSNCPLQLV